MNYDPSFAARARDLCYVGLKEAEIAPLLGVSITTLRSWREQYPEFNYAWKDGCAHADGKVAAALFKRACGYTTTKWRVTKDGRFEEEVHVAADVSAIVFWLTNRQPEHWQSKVEHTGPHGAILPVDAMSEIEAARHVAFALSKAMHMAIEDRTRSIEHDSGSPNPPKTK